MQDVAVFVHVLIFESKFISIAWFNTNVIVNVALARTVARKMFPIGFSLSLSYYSSDCKVQLSSSYLGLEQKRLNSGAFDIVIRNFDASLPPW